MEKAVFKERRGPRFIRVEDPVPGEGHPSASGLQSPEAFLPWFRSLIPGTRHGRSRGSSAKLLSALDNYPEFLAKQVFVNVPWWYLSFQSDDQSILTQRTKSKFSAGPSKSARRPLQPSAKKIIEIPLTEFILLPFETVVKFLHQICRITIFFSCSHAFDLGASCAGMGCLLCLPEFVPSSEESYTIIVQKGREDSFLHDLNCEEQLQGW
ncbi:hypothetical protein HPP92_018815 [Vanilla planifolia]|uniref:Uncharacterized protein n=1 Tax=Vanilla planifolia TaxID=51239 RepID=A0A835UMC3_VANPL|nr:hypothetical protein HPP92_018815 [Vanilla planifolia]